MRNLLSTRPVLSRGKLIAFLALLALLGGCSSTSSQVQEPLPSNSPLTVSAGPVKALIDQVCYSQAEKIAAAAETSGSMAQYLSAGRYMQSCLQNPMSAPLDNSQSQAVMQLMAKATVNFIQGGDIAAAQQQLRRFEQRFPDQDLYLPDYTSFRDTASALLNKHSSSANQLAQLNISRELREELERQAYWLSH
jgi:hypothetical protein